jgi:hypothetical protein
MILYAKIKVFRQEKEETNIAQALGPSPFAKTYEQGIS